MTVDNNMVQVHPWDTKGVGSAPYRLVGVFSIPHPPEGWQGVEAYQRELAQAFAIARQFGVDAGNCNICFTNLSNHYVIRSAEGRHFVVGCDCVAKTGNTELITVVEKAERDRKRAIRAAKRQAEQQALRAKIEAELQAEREANGGLTNYELRQELVRQEREAIKAAARAANDWLILSLDGNHPFIVDMVKKLSTERFDSANFSVGQYNALLNCYLRGYKGSERKERQAVFERNWQFAPPKENHPSWR